MIWSFLIWGPTHHSPKDLNMCWKCKLYMHPKDFLIDDWFPLALVRKSKTAPEHPEDTAMLHWKQGVLFNTCLTFPPLGSRSPNAPLLFHHFTSQNPKTGVGANFSHARGSMRMRVTCNWKLPAVALEIIRPFNIILRPFHRLCQA